jgi:RecA-family ATPase
MRLVSLSTYAHLPRPNLDWIVHKLLPRPGLVLLIGPPKVGKSFLGLDIGLHVAHGRPFLGQKTNPSPVWYLQLDTSEAVWRDRLHDLEEAGVDLGGPLYMAHPEETPRPFNILTASAQQFVRDALKEGDPGLVIVDVLRKFHSADENDSTDMKKVSDVLDTLFHDRCLLVLHHTRKLSAEVENPDVTHLARGSGFITGQADAIWLLVNGKLKIVSRFDEDLTYRAERQDTGLFTFPDIVHRTEAQARVLALCAEFPGDPHRKLVAVAAQRWGMSRASYYRYLAGQECAHRGGATGTP